jgi:type I restriction enzyme, S subunit
MKWERVALEQVADVHGGSTPRRNREEYWHGDIPWVTPRDLPMPGFEIADVFDTTEKISAEGLNSCAANILPPGTVLFSSRATIGKLGIARAPLTTNQGFVNFAPGPCIDSKYLAYALLAHTPEITALAGATTFKEVSRGALRKFQIPLPPPSEQRRIVDILEQADQLRKNRGSADATFARILPALFYRMFGDPATNPKHWATAPLEELVEIGTQLVDPNQSQYLDLPHIGGEQI